MYQNVNIGIHRQLQYAAEQLQQLTLTLEPVWSAFYLDLTSFYFSTYDIRGSPDCFHSREECKNGNQEEEKDDDNDDG